MKSAEPGRVISAAISAAELPRPRVVTLAKFMREETAEGCLKEKVKVEGEGKVKVEGEGEQSRLVSCSVSAEEI